MEPLELVLSDSLSSGQPSVIFTLPTITSQSQSTSLSLKAEGIHATFCCGDENNMQAAFLSPIDVSLFLRKISLASTESSLTVGNDWLCREVVINFFRSPLVVGMHFSSISLSLSLPPFARFFTRALKCGHRR